MTDEKDDSQLLHGFGYLLHQTTPTKLLGSVAGETSSRPPGQVVINIFQEQGDIDVTLDEETMSLLVNEEIALELAKNILRVAAENRWLRARGSTRQEEPG